MRYRENDRYLIDCSLLHRLEVLAVTRAARESHRQPALVQCEWGNPRATAPESGPAA
jgi:hypothetical protein